MVWLTVYRLGKLGIEPATFQQNNDHLVSNSRQKLQSQLSYIIKLILTKQLRKTQLTEVGSWVVNTSVIMVE